MNGLPKGSGTVASEWDLSSREMYSVKKPYSLPDVQLPNCMYQVQPINMQAVSDSNHDLSVSGMSGSTSRGTLTEPKVLKSSCSSMMTQSSLSAEALDNLEQRQMKIIEQLTSLKEIISNTHVQCVNSRNAAVAVEVKSEVTDDQFLSGENIDVVIHANPSRPPYSLLFFVNIFEETYTNAVVSMKSHIHSSFRGRIDPAAVSIFNQEKEGANLKFVLVWKEVENCKMIITPVESTYIDKESNIARFLSRLLPITNDTFNYDCLTWDVLVKVDNLLDQLNNANAVSLVEKELKNSKSNWLTGKPTIADLVLYSAVVSKVLHGGQQKNLPLTVKNWITSVEVGLGLHNCIFTPKSS